MPTMIRCSMLPAYPDCPRRGAARQWPAEIEAAGFELRQIEPSAGAAVGTAVHHAAAQMLIGKRESGNAGKPEDAVEWALIAFRAEVGRGAVWDDSTPNARTAETQITRQTRMYANTVVQEAQPFIVENTWPGEDGPRRLRADLGDDFLLTGTIDLVQQQLDLDDLKTGVLPRPYQSQFGGYSLLLRSQPDGFTPRSLRRTWLERTRLSKPQKAPEREVYDRGDSERAAAGTVAAIKANLTQFRRGGSKDPWAFPANPMSMLCSSKYCPAHSTGWCTLGRKEG